MNQPRSFATIITALLLLLPVLYVGSYLALVEPEGVTYKHHIGQRRFYFVTAPYRYQGRFCTHIFWPLEQIDRKVRPEVWEYMFEHERRLLASP
jgi:hypothetical protein